MKAYGYIFTVEENPWRGESSGVYSESGIVNAESPEEAHIKIEEKRKLFNANPQVIAIKKYNEK